jgi:glycosyltransferase involved in cell wall biosynthesis
VGVKKRILVVCMFDSIHSARWLSQFKDSGYEFLLFPSSPHRRVRPELKALLTSRGASNYKLFPLSKYFGLPFWIADKFLGNLIRGTLVRQAARSFKPDIVHLLELQNAGYIGLSAFENQPRKFSLIATNWGSDIYWFQKFEGHKQKLTCLLAISDYYSAECHRDVQLAKNLGFSGTALPVIPNAGGFAPELLSLPRTSAADRKVIAIKGYEGWVGRAITALKAVEQIADQLKGFDFEVYSANQKTVRFAKQLAKRTGFNIRIHPKGALSHSQVLDLFSRSRIYVGLSESDGISTSLLEAMAMGAIPVQTSTACCDEWFGDSGVAVRSIDPDTVASSILRGLELSKDQSNADTNRATIMAKANADDVALIARGFYETATAS